MDEGNLQFDIYDPDTMNIDNLLTIVQNIPANQRILCGYKLLSKRETRILLIMLQDFIDKVDNL